MEIVVFGSGLGTNLEAILHAQNERSSSFRVKGIFTDRACRMQTIAEEHRIPILTHSFKEFVKSYAGADTREAKMRMEYDEKNASLLLKMAEEHCFSIDMIILAGYMRLVYPPLLSCFSQKIINIHPADLTVLDEKGRRRYVGTNPVYEALADGLNKTRSSVILVEEEMDEGAILVSGPWVAYEEGYPVTQEKAAEHQAKQKHKSDFPACLAAIKLLAEGRLGLDAEKRVYVDGVLMAEKGWEIGSEIRGSCKTPKKWIFF